MMFVIDAGGQAECESCQLDLAKCMQNKSLWLEHQQYSPNCPRVQRKGGAFFEILRENEVCICIQMIYFIGKIHI